MPIKSQSKPKSQPKPKSMAPLLPVQVQIEFTNPELEKLHRAGEKPVARAHPESAGIDVYAAFHDEQLRFSPSSGTFMVPLGFRMAMLGRPLQDFGLVALLLPRSSSGCLKGLALGNTIGVIDADYRGQVQACVYLRGTEGIYTMPRFEKIGQLVIVPAWLGQVEVVKSLPDSARGEGGFGSSDKPS